MSKILAGIPRIYVPLSTYMCMYIPISSTTYSLGFLERSSFTTVPVAQISPPRPKFCQLNTISVFWVNCPETAVREDETLLKASTTMRIWLPWRLRPRHRELCSSDLGYKPLFGCKGPWGAFGNHVGSTLAGIWDVSVTHLCQLRGTFQGLSSA